MPVLSAASLFLDLLAKAEEDFEVSPDGDGTVRWRLVFNAADITAVVKQLGFPDLHAALHHAHARANAKNILDS
jgi:hypothetical protein